MLNLLFALLFACQTHEAQLRAVFSKEAPGLQSPLASEKVLTPLWVGPGFSGSWFNPARSGEGWTLEILEDGSAVVVWFTFSPPGTSNPQAWILGQNGSVVGNTIVFRDVFTARGGRFGPNFDPAQVQLTPWGEMSFEFASCGSGTMRYTGPAAFGSGSHPITRLTALDELDCAGTRMLTAAGARDGSKLKSYVGAWLDPSHNGEGWVIETLSATQAGVYWFSFTPNGEQAWFLGLGTLEGNRLRIDAMVRSVGTVFGAGFDPALVNRAPWGTLEFEFSSCNSATVRYTSSQEGYGSGTLNAVRLTTLASATCLDTLRVAQNTGTWSQGATMPLRTSEVATAVVEGKVYSAGGLVGQRHFERYDPVANAWTVLPELPGGRDHAEAVGYGGAFWLFGGYPGTGGGSIAPSARFDPATNAWEILANVPEVAASGAALLNGSFYLGETSGLLVQYNPRTRTSRLILAGETVERDHSQVVAYLGEVWMIGGRSQSTGEQPRVTIFNPVTETWRRGPSLRSARAGFAAAVVNDQIMVAGGEILFSGNALNPTFEMIAPGANAWVHGPGLPVAVHGVGGASFGGRFYAVGGSITPGIANNPGVIQIYTPAP